MALFTSRNRFNEFKADFLTDTGLKNVEDNLELYTQYVIARFTDHNNKLLGELSNELQELTKVLKKV